MPLEAVRQQQRLEVRMPVEEHAEHLMRLALVPVRASVDADGGGQARVRARHPGPYEQVVALRQGVDVRHDREPVLQLVHGAQPVEVAAGELVAGEGQRLDPQLRRHVHREHAERVLAVHLVAEPPRPRHGQLNRHRGIPE
jgi:hypothetical protein